MLGGCYTVEGIRAAPPARTGEIAGDYRFLAACMARPYQNGADVSVIPDESTRTATVLAVRHAGFSSTPLFDVTLRDAGQGRTQVEIRPAPSVSGASADSAYLWGTLERCSAQAAQAAPSQR